MAVDLKKVDPKWAWAAWTPSEERGWTRGLAAHLYRRAGFGANSAELAEAEKAGVAATVKKLTEGAGDERETDGQVASLVEREADELGMTVMAGGDPQKLSAWWLYRMMTTADQGLEKLTLFWHGHFATSAVKVKSAAMMMRHYAVLRRYARGKFGAFVQEMSKDPAMLVWLDSTTNRKARPNENYARELMELFCLGVGNYTEQDIKEIARAFTGWEVRGDRFRFNAHQHDGGVKTFLGRSGRFGGEDAVRVVLEQEAAPRFIARKLVRYFVLDEPEAPDALIEPLAKELRANDFAIGATVRRILSSNLFYSERVVGRKVRSPVELAVGLLRALEGMTNQIELAEALGRLGQMPFYPPNVKGWDGGQTWINTSTLLGRANVVAELTIGGKGRFGDGGLGAVAKKAGVKGAEGVVDWLLELLVAVEIPDEVRGALVKTAEEGGAGEDGTIGRVVHAISTLPEFQLS